jgi:acyl-[acyl-carrier-protein]-phospholipid O-acyltransferase/long-chain-fatty-acid--[acyl-carrier-protein] ligase
MTLPRKLLRMCRHHSHRIKVADLSGQEWTGKDLLLRTLVVRRVLRRRVFGNQEEYVGLLLPPSVAGVMANAAVSLDRRVAVNLNYTFSSEQINFCIKEAGIRHVLTSRLAMRKFGLTIDSELVYLEDLKGKVTAADKLIGAGQSRLPVPLLERLLRLTRSGPDDVLTVIFTSGTTGQPKGAMLTHRNIGSNIEGFNSVIRLDQSDTVAGILPFFHSFGYTVTLWGALTLDPKVAYHYTPLEAKEISRLCKLHGVTILIATPTFLRLYAARCKREDLAKLEVVLSGAEKLPTDLADNFENKLGVRPYEGYGTTELSPVVTMNVPPSRHTNSNLPGAKEGTVGRPLPGVAAKVVDVDTGEDLGVNRSGMLLIKGPNVMRGYLGKPDETAEVIRDGWYETGDVAVIDDEGFIEITGRLGSFSKIGGEMVSHGFVEERIVEALSPDLQTEEEPPNVAVTSVPDPKKGERLVVLHTGLKEEPEVICRRLSHAGVPPICIPSSKCFHRIEEIPVLGTGKRHLRRIRELARELEGCDGCVPQPS